MTEYDLKTPIYLQVIDKMKARILSGLWPPGSRVLSVRELAVQFEVNPNTMQRSLSEMEREGLMYTERTSGRFITEDREILEASRRITAVSIITVFANRMRELGFSIDEIIKLIEEEYNA